MAEDPNPYSKMVVARLRDYTRIIGHIKRYRISWGDVTWIIYPH